MKTQQSQKEFRQQQLHTWINQNTDYQCDSLEMVSGDASFRRYFRFVCQGQTIIAVDAPPEHENASQFIAVAQRYHQAGVQVPEIFASNLKLGFYIQQDFGNRLLSDVLTPDTCDQMYSKALGIIPQIQSCTETKAQPLPLYNAAFIDKELALFSDWLLDKYLALRVTESEQKMLNTVFASVKASCLAQPMVGVHRDYHSRNLMLLEGNEIGVIDFQDAVVGPITYDAVSLLRDSYQDWPQEKVIEWLLTWHTKYYSKYPWPAFKMWFDCVGMQRHIKIAGIFARLCARDNKPGYLADIPHTLDYLLIEADQYPDYAEFASFIRGRLLPVLLQKLKLNQDDS